MAKNQKKVFTDESLATFVGEIKTYTDSSVNNVAVRAAYIDEEDNENVTENTSGSNIIVDSSLSTVSTNPVQNKVVTNKLNELSEEITGYETNPLYGKKVSFNGDSICAGAGFTGGYGKIIAERNNMTYQNIAVGGGTITAETYSGSTGNPLHWICRTIQNMDSSADYAIIEGGVNDTSYVENIGSISKGYNATLDDETYCGAFESMLKQLIIRFKGKKIGFIAVSMMPTQYYHIALECCEKWGVPVCDLKASTPPINSISELSNLYTTDGVHPNEDGYKKYYCDQIESWLKNLVVSGNSMLSTHNEDETSHSDIRDLITKLQNGKLDSNGISIKKALLPLANGTTIEVDVLVTSEGTIVVKYTNQVPISIDTNGTVFNNTGYMDGYRLSSTGATKETDHSTVSGYIPAKAGDVVRIGGVAWRTNTNSSNYICAYDISFNFIGAITGNDVNYGTIIYSSVSTELDTKYTEITLKEDVSNIAYIRVSTTGSTNVSLDGNGNYNGEVGANMIVTINEEIIN